MRHSISLPWPGPEKRVNSGAKYIFLLKNPVTCSAGSHAASQVTLPGIYHHADIILKK
jgi:hypothetical protein